MKRFSKKTDRTTDADAPKDEQSSADRPEEQSEEKARAEAEKKRAGEPEKRVLLVLIASDPTTLDDLITTMLDIGVAGATILESKGMGAILREEMPIFAGLASMLPQNTGSRVVLSIATPSIVERLFTILRDEMKQGERPIALSVPIDAATGLTR